MKRIVVSSVIAVVASTLLLGIAYPLVITGLAQVIPTRAAQVAVATHVGDPRYFQPRPSQTDYSADATAFANRGPNSSSAKYFYRDQIEAYRRMNGAAPPMDAVTNSASGRSCSRSTCRLSFVGAQVSSSSQNATSSVDSSRIPVLRPPARPGARVFAMTRTLRSLDADLPQPFWDELETLVPGPEHWLDNNAPIVW